MDPVDTNRDRIIPRAVGRLEKLTEESVDLVKQMETAFSEAITERPDIDEVHKVARASTGSNLGQTLMRLADRLDRSFVAIRAVIDAADL